ncbi:P-loop containing nucleoside triphosphate hydrolases superfamily protein [Actinidia rufa]|uniref:P-loop containing nucleoside triphosphate hydrolases superfamily protein n=1 Tax=Actinidia rufa TaxID=165716 RepID=A0A7J0HB16_9ERIC|nr:P-loop containing nucleoside triphosphate hydrolases superfamily protein [Actinidia rufa]
MSSLSSSSSDLGRTESTGNQRRRRSEGSIGPPPRLPSSPEFLCILSLSLTSSETANLAEVPLRCLSLSLLNEWFELEFVGNNLLLFYGNCWDFRGARKMKLVEKGRKYFDEMLVLDINPTQMHYACIVDLLGRASLLVMVVDARDPLFYRCPDLEAYAREIDEHKRTLLLINKADLLPFFVRDKWAKYFRLHGILFVFWSSKAASAALEGKTLRFPTEIQNSLQESGDADTKIYGREELLARLQAEAEEIAMTRRSSCSSCAHSPGENVAGNTSKSVIVGFVGYPNVGKSSTINALVGEKRTGVTSTPGKTKHFQTFIMSDELTLCDCPGLVFPSFTSSRYEMIASGVLPIDRMTEHREAVQVVANRVPRHVIDDVYNITLPKPKPYEPQSRPPSAAEFLRAYCASRGYVASSGLPDETRAARQILKDYIDGKLPHFELPSGMANDRTDLEAAAAASSLEMHESDTSDTESPPNSEDESGPSLEHILNDLNSFDMANGLGPRKVPVQKKPANASHKQHKKPQRTKNRLWRVQNDDGDGMPVVRVFQKPVNTGPVKVG